MQSGLDPDRQADPAGPPPGAPDDHTFGLWPEVAGLLLAAALVATAFLLAQPSY